MERKKIFVLVGHPDSDTFSGALATSYVKGAESKGHEVRRVNLGEVAFDPILHKGYKVIQELEPGLKEIQGHILWADHFVVVYPNWWNTMPALLKGFFDRAWLPGFAFNFDKVNRKIIKRLAGKTARVIIAAGTNSGFITWWKYGDYKNEIQRGILEFSGFNPVEISTFGPCDISGDAEKNNWISEAYALGEKGA